MPGLLQSLLTSFSNLFSSADKPPAGHFSHYAILYWRADVGQVFIHVTQDRTLELFNGGTIVSRRYLGYTERTLDQVLVECVDHYLKSVPSESPMTHNCETWTTQFGQVLFEKQTPQQTDPPPLHASIFQVQLDSPDASSIPHGEMRSW